MMVEGEFLRVSSLDRMVIQYYILPGMPLFGKDDTFLFRGNSKCALLLFCTMRKDFRYIHSVFAEEMQLRESRKSNLNPSECGIFAPTIFEE